jgi:hypothetical protein
MSEDPVYSPFVLLALQAAKRAQQVAESEVQQEKAAPSRDSSTGRERSPAIGRSSSAGRSN